MRVTVDVGDIAGAIRRDIESYHRAIIRGLEWVGQELSSEITRSAPVKSNRLRSSIHPTGIVEEEAGEIQLKVGIMQPRGSVVLKYARVRDEGTAYLPGGVIKAKTERGLFFPVSGAAFTRSGVGGLSYGQAKAAGLAKGTEWRRVQQVAQEGSGYLTKTAAEHAPSLLDKYIRRALEEIE